MKKIAKPILELSNICRSDKKSTIERLNLSIPGGNSFAVLYKNDDNISLLMEILSGRVSPKKGKIFFKGDDVTGERNVFGVVRKEPTLPKLKTVADFAAVPVVKRGLSRSMTDVLVRKELSGFGLSEFANESFSKLSERDAGRAIIFSAYMCSHEFMAIDEPFSSLKADDQRSELEWLKGLCRDKSLSLLVFTKSVDAAVFLADYVMIADKNTCSAGIIAVQPGKEKKAAERISEIYAAV